MKAHGLGRLVRKPELKQTTNSCVAEFTLAFNEFIGSGDDKKKKTSFLDCVAWDKGAEVIAERADQGDQMYVDATARQEKWTDKEGNPRSRVVFRVNEFRIVPKLNKDVDN